MSKMKKNVLTNLKLNEDKDMALNEEWNNFMKRIGEVGNIVKDLAGGDKEKAEAAKVLADQYLDGKVILDEDVQMTVKSDRTVINQKAFKFLENKDSERVDPEVWMAEMSKDAQKRHQDRKIRREKADTFKTQAVKAFRRGEYEKALSCYNKALEQVRDNSIIYCERALTNIKLGNYDKVFDDCYWAQRINENSFKARLYKAKAHKELDQLEQLEECLREMEELFPQHQDLINYFLNKKEGCEEQEEAEDTPTITVNI